MFECKRNRSKFWMRIRKNDDNINISASRTTKGLIQRTFPHLEEESTWGWIQSRRYTDVFNLQIADEEYDWQDLEDLKLWAEQTNKYIWLNTNRHTEAYFSGLEVDYCVAYDWNYDFATMQRTAVGNAEYLLKYRARSLSYEEKLEQVVTLADAVQSCVSALPIESGEYVVTTIPATEGKQNKLAWKLARFISRTNNIPFVGVTLSREKPEMKTLPLEDKIKVWRDIYSDNDWVIVPSDLYGKKVLIVDDLFQSGASIFCFAEFLKNSLDVKEVSAVASVKAQKDGDNA